MNERLIPWDDFVFVDIETTGLDPNRHSILEVSYAVGLNDPVTFYPRIDQDDLINAEPQALIVNQWLHRWQAQDEVGEWWAIPVQAIESGVQTQPYRGEYFTADDTQRSNPLAEVFLDLPKFAEQEDYNTFAAAIKDKYWVGAAPNFDVTFLSGLFNPERLSHKHRLWDIQQYYAGQKGLRAPVSFKTIVDDLNTQEIDMYDGYREIKVGDHTAEGDVVTTRQVFARLLDYAEFVRLWDHENNND